MADIEGSFELAKVQWRFSRQPAGGVTEDVAVMTFHVLDTAAPSVPWVDSGKCTTVENALSTMWGAIKVHFPSWLISDQYRWYHDGPAYYHLDPVKDPYHYLPNGDNPAFRITEVDVAGTSIVNSTLPPQLAMTITEKTSRRKSWGRVYLPNGDPGLADHDGRLTASIGSTLVGAAGSAYGTVKAAGLPFVVFSIQKPDRPIAGGKMLGAQVARALEITSLVMDNVFDVIRSRRWDHATQRFTAVV